MNYAYHAATTGDGGPESYDRRRIGRLERKVMHLENDVFDLTVAESRRRDWEEFAIGFVTTSAALLMGIMLGRERH